MSGNNTLIEPDDESTITTAIKKRLFVETGKGALGYLKNFITSIEALSNKTGVKDERISSSKGNIRAFVGNDSY